MDNNGKVYTEAQLLAFEKGWANFMVDVWHDRMMQLHIRDTGALIRSVRGRVEGSEGNRRITHEFLLYGIYVAAGVGNGYKRGNGGNLEFLGNDYRKAHGMGKPRQRRDWFSKKYLYSIRRLNEKEAAFYGEAYQGLLSTAISDMFDKNSPLRSL